MNTTIPSEYYDENYIPGTTNILTGQQTELTSISSNKSLKRDKKGFVLIPQPTDSPNDPLNWSNPKKILQFSLLIFYTALTAATSNDAGAAQDSLNEIYGISYDAMNTGAGVLFAAIGINCWLLAPSVDLYGRKISYLICLAASVGGCIWFSVSRKTSDTIWSQLFVGAGESAAEAMVQVSICDLFFQNNLGSVLTLYIAATSIGTYLGPLIAGFIAQYQTFRWVGGWGAIITFVTLVVFIFGLEESSFNRQAHFKVFESSSINESQENIYNDEKTNKIDDSKLASDEEKGEFTNPTIVKSNLENYVSNVIAEEDKPKSYWRRISPITPAHNIEGFGFKQYGQRLLFNLKIFQYPIVLFSGLLWALQDAFLSFYLTSEDTTYYDPPYNKSNTGVALMNIPCLIGAILGCIFAGYISDLHVDWLAKRNGGVMEAEFRLYLLFVTLFISPLGLLLFGIGTDRDWPWPVMYVGLGLVGFGFGSVGDCSSTYSITSYPDLVLQSMVAISLINNLIACLFTFCCSIWLDASGTTNTYIALAVIDFVTIGLIIPFIYYGKDLRKHSKKSYIEMVEKLNEWK
ncbi:uncharacterized protein KGF55_002537 [Candida pseudojiufengensis]|uniref:uncharacterized protein n=1 Tax=Candida pseudojiufengensis TaxID=497109 RepID=UPI0022256DE7|nr:uncharacterized protein KGF55_002537 [Candida pseudojiufengensis]KAI5963657.1 hypothetical protein KGF55_002537 [Candida pseudojiufengensis]